MVNGAAIPEEELAKVGTFLDIYVARWAGF